MQYRQPPEVFYEKGFSNKFHKIRRKTARGRSRTAATCKMEFPAVNYYHKVRHLGYCGSPRYAFENLCQSLVFNKVAGLRCFPANFAKFVRTHFL